MAARSVTTGRSSLPVKARWLRQYPRDLKAMAQRLDKIATSPERASKWTAEIARLWKQHEDRLTKHRKAGVSNPHLAQFRRQLEALRVSLFAQVMKTPGPVSVERLEKLGECRRCSAGVPRLDPPKSCRYSNYTCERDIHAKAHEIDRVEDRAHRQFAWSATAEGDS
jgi:hypothetical protein